MTNIMFAIGIGCLGLWLGSLIERVISFAKLRSELRGLIDRIDGQVKS